MSVDASASDSTENPASRVVLLGASNLTLGFPLIVPAVRRAFAGPVSFYAAHGHGRSYGRWSYVVVRGLPPIHDCGLWDNLQPGTGAERTFALVTDVGNDLLYRQSASDILSWVLKCFEKLRAIDAEIIWVRPPLGRILDLSAIQYHSFKQLFFPGPATPWPQVRRDLLWLDDKITARAIEVGAHVVTPERAWYGIDPIHIRTAQRRTAWEAIFNNWSGVQEIEARPPGLVRAIHLWSLAPLERSWLWRTTKCTQPALTWEDGSALALY